MGIKHKFQSTKIDGPDTTVVRPSNWNDEHDIVGTIPVSSLGTGIADATTFLRGDGTWAFASTSGGSGTGQSGYSGYSGISGYSGATGPTGPQGISGYSGAGSSAVGIDFNNVPRLIYMIYGDSTDLGHTPDATTQASINALLALGVPANNIRWLYEVGQKEFILQNVIMPSLESNIVLTRQSATFNIQNMLLGSQIDIITLTNPAQLAFIIQNASLATLLTSITLTRNSANFSAIADLLLPTLEGSFSLTRQSASFVGVASLTLASSADNITLSVPVVQNLLQNPSFETTWALSGVYDNWFADGGIAQSQAISAYDGSYVAYGQAGVDDGSNGQLAGNVTCSQLLTRAEFENATGNWSYYTKITNMGYSPAVWVVVQAETSAGGFLGTSSAKSGTVSGSWYHNSGTGLNLADITWTPGPSTDVHHYKFLCVLGAGAGYPLNQTHGAFDLVSFS